MSKDWIIPVPTESTALNNDWTISTNFAIPSQNPCLEAPLFESKFWTNLPIGIKRIFMKKFRHFDLILGKHDSEIKAFLKEFIEEAFNGE